MRNVRYKRSLGVAAVGVALGVTAFGSVGAQADQGTNDAAKAGTATISMEFDGKGAPFFEGSRSVNSGDELQIVNNSDPKDIGPHTFSLVEKDLLPDLDKQSLKDCYKGGVCVNIFKAHKVEKRSVGRIVARSGKDGWDASFGKRGDSYFALQKDDSFSQVVSAKPGTTLYYLCAIHPEMQGKIKVK